MSKHLLNTKVDIDGCIQMRSKDEVLSKFKLVLADIEARGFTVTTFHSDNGGEYTSEEFENYSRLEKNIIPHRTPPNTPQANAVTERFNRVLGERARALLKTAQLPKCCGHKLWRPWYMCTIDCLPLEILDMRTRHPMSCFMVLYLMYRIYGYLAVMLMRTILMLVGRSWMIQLSVECLLVMMRNVKL